MSELRAARTAMVKQVRDIPHLRLLDDVDHRGLAGEALAALARAGVAPTRFDIDGFDALRVAGVVDRGRDPMLGGQHHYPGSAQAEAELEPTDLGALMPRTLELIDRLTSVPGRVKLSILRPGGKVEYHAHDDVSYVVHVPLVSNAGVRMLVRMDGVEYPQVYEPGTAWLFNSHHEHAVTNDGAEPRLHLWCNFMQISKEAVNQRIKALIDTALHTQGGGS